jgi:hypothetical protein
VPVRLHRLRNELEVLLIHLPCLAGPLYSSRCTTLLQLSGMVKQLPCQQSYRNRSPGGAGVETSHSMAGVCRCWLANSLRHMSPYWS